LFLQANNANLVLRSFLGNAELNYRDFGLSPGMELLAGFRYCDVNEQFSMEVTDDTTPVPAGTVLYQTVAHNHILAPQLGLVFYKQLVPSFTVSATFKGAWGLNIIDSSVLLERGDGLVGFNTSRTHETFGQVYEIGLMADWALGNAIHLRGGYTAMWVLGVAEAAEQFSFDLSQTSGSIQNNGHIFYQGPTVEVLFAF
jgi:hypothetical protein